MSEYNKKRTREIIKKKGGEQEIEKWEEKKKKGRQDLKIKIVSRGGPFFYDLLTNECVDKFNESRKCLFVFSFFFFFGFFGVFEQIYGEGPCHIPSLVALSLGLGRSIKITTVSVKSDVKSFSHMLL